MLESQCSKGSAMVSIRTSDEGIKKDVVRQGSTNKTIKNESTRSSIHDERRQAHLTHAEGYPYENSNSSSLEIGEFNKKKIERLRTLLNSLEKTNGSRSFSQSGHLLADLGLHEEEVLGINEDQEEELKYLDELSIDELQGSLLVHEQKIIQEDKEEQALKASTNNNALTTNRSADRGRGKGRGVRGARDGGRGRGGRGNFRADEDQPDFQNRGKS
ncbi:hypothetical protein CK203_100659 [Vitis vinifera]|uniref:Uncharacterized protein n=1 Tax=Vitis vinifera TaxID=29760 RepID=A0A438D6A9_VITVI|nr:hypothetical protein CK203_100659 [Vitis vinifera]